MDFLVRWLASLFEAFKLKNPLVATVVLVALAATLNTVSNGQLWGLFTLPEWANQVVKYLAEFLLIVTGTQTFRYLPASKQKTARE